MNFYNPSGGLTYHYLAWRYKKTLWLNYQKSLSSWLKTWNPHECHLILIGASGGYNLSDDFLRKFDSITAYDPDPFAHFFFKRNHPQVNLKWSHSDLIGVTPGEIKNFSQYFSENSNAAILFCNVIGQLPLLLQKNESLTNPGHPFTDTEIENFMKNLSEEIYTLSEVVVNGKRRSVASFHDLYSRNLSPGQENILRDHMTNRMFSDELWHKENLKWSLTSQEEHQIECVFRKI